MRKGSAPDGDRLLSKKELRALGKRRARKLLGTDWDNAVRRVDEGEFDGTQIEMEIRSIRFLLDGR